MKVWTAAVGIAGLSAGLLVPSSSQPTPGDNWTIVIAGDVAGYLQPCGCTPSMSGGIKRWATAVRALGDPSRVLVLENAGLVAGNGPQDRLKAEALVQALDSVQATAINVGSREAALGPGELNQLSQLSNGKLVSTSLGPNQQIGIAAFARKGPFLIGAAVTQPSTLSALGGSPLSGIDSAKRLVAQATAEGLTPILMLEGNRQEATEIAAALPAIKLIVFSQGGEAPLVAYDVGSTKLVTPGEHGIYLVRISYAKKRFSNYSITDLGPNVHDDPKVSSFYSQYLRTVDNKHLIDAWPRKTTEPYVGSTRCGSCHQSSFKVWERSKHRGSYTDLSAQGHGKDPDCVVCHVTGLGSDQGFRDLVKTPDLGYVGCESCHGPGDKHTANPFGFKMPKIGEKSCRSCHDPENSPRFQFLTYWSQIRH